MVTSSHRPSAGFITRHVSPTLSPQPSGPHPLRRGCSSIFLPLPQDKPSVCFKHTQWLMPSCFTYTFLFFPLLDHHWTLREERLQAVLRYPCSELRRGGCSLNTVPVCQPTKAGCLEASATSLFSSTVAVEVADYKT